jgi:hypothetical protein
VNLLPVDLSFCIRGHSLSGNIKPGRLSPVYKVIKQNNWISLIDTLAEFFLESVWPSLDTSRFGT